MLLLGCSHKTAPPESTSATAKPSTPAYELPTDGFVKDGIYTNSFFKFSIEFPRAWKILDTGTHLTGNNMGPAAGLIPSTGNNVEAAYSLLWAGTVDKQTQNLHWVVICAFKPTSSALNATPEKYLRVEADSAKLGAAEYLRKGQTPPLTAGEPTESHISGRQVARLDETGEINNKPARMVQMVTDERGYLILFIFADSTEDVANYQAPKAISSLRFFGNKN